MSSTDSESVPVTAALSRAWRRGEPDDAVVDRAYQRFLQRRPRRAGTPVLRHLSWVALGTLLSIGSLYAATTKPWRLLDTPNDVTSLQKPSARVPQPQQVDRGAPRSVTPLPAAPSSSVTAGPGSSVPALRIPSKEEAVRESWQRAAQGLRERDFTAADDALRRLSEQGTTLDREAALLARAQLRLSQGQVAAALELSTRLAASAESESIRQRAVEIARQARQRNASERSFDPAPVTKPP